MGKEQTIVSIFDRIRAMGNKELYRHLLRINEPWTVEQVDLDMTRGQVDVYVRHVKGMRFACPECGMELTSYDQSILFTYLHPIYFNRYSNLTQYKNNRETSI